MSNEAASVSPSAAVIVLSSLRSLMWWTIGLFVIFLIARLTASKLVDPQWVLAVAGIQGDLLAGFTAAALIALARAASRWLAMALLTLVVVLAALNLEHIYALDDVLRIQQAEFAFDFNFIAGTVLQLRTFPFAVLAAVAAVALWSEAPKLPNGPVALTLAAAALIAGSAMLWSNVHSASSWREANPTALLLTELLPRSGTVVTVAADSKAHDFFKLEIGSGEPKWIEQANADSRPNILLLILEGIPGAYLRQVQDATGYSSPITMERVSAFAERALIAPNTVTHGEGTIRGTYSILCGDYSGQDGQPKSARYIQLDDSDWFPCLPEILRRDGYRTEYLQAANLEYMDKNQFLPLVGFDRVDNPPASRQSGGNFWGVDDLALFRHAERRIAQLEEQGPEPWFMTLLNVGTHHPYNAPDSYIASHPSRKQAAVAYLDDAVGGLLSYLDEQGVLDDTLVIVTSDESHGVPGHDLGQNWGTLVVAGPGVKPGVNPGVHGILDIPVTVLDLLGKADDSLAMIGRSALRAYQGQRSILFGDFVSRRADQAVVCRRDHCRTLRSGNGMLFAPSYTASSGALQDSGSWAELAFELHLLKNQFHGRDDQVKYLLALQGETIEGTNRSLLNNSFALPAGFIHVKLGLDNESSEPVDLNWLWQDEKGGKLFREFQFRLGTLLPASSLSLDFGFPNPEDRKIDLVLFAVSKGGPIKTTVDTFLVSHQELQPGKGQPFIHEAQVYVPSSQLDLMQYENGQHIYANAIISLDAAEESLSQSSYEIGRRGAAPYMRYLIGETIEFGSDSPWYSRLMLGADWSYPEEWGVWSDGPEPTLNFHVDQFGDTAGFRLQLRLIPYVHPDLVPEQKITPVLNGQALGELSFTEQIVHDIDIPVNADLLNAGAGNYLGLVVETPFAPARYNEGTDETELGVGIVSFALKPGA